MRRITIFSGLGLAALMAGLAFAVTPMTVGYQGRLTTATGTAVPDASYSVAFAIYGVPTGGIPIWSELQTVGTADGLFAVTLGAVTPLSDTVFNTATRYLGVRIGSDAELLPRVALVSVPYAMRVSSVDGARGGAIGGNIDLENSSASGGTVYKGGVPFLHNVGTDNTFLGLNAGNLASTGSWSNTGLGTNALRGNTTGTNNTAVGRSALSANQDGFQNTATGVSALEKNISGRDNTASGLGALNENTSGHYNAAVGSLAAHANTTGSWNAALGYSALKDNDTGHANCAIGAMALEQNVTGAENVGAGLYSLQTNTSGSQNTGCGARSLWYNRAGKNNTALGYSANVGYDSLVNATAIGANAIVDASNKIRLGDDNVAVIEGRVPYTYTSDVREKENFEQIDPTAVLEKVRTLTCSSWNYKNQDPAKFRHYGPVAQEFYAAFGHDGIGQCGDSVTINSGDLSGITLIAVQALAERMDELRLLRSEVQALRKRLEHSVETNTSR